VAYVPQELFGSAAAHYARYRSGYPQELLDTVAARTGLDSRQRVLDIGCGTGQVAIPLARHASAVVAIDPAASMLAHGRAAARAAGVPNITWRQGAAGQVAALAGPGAHVAVFAASFHWTDRPAVLATLDRVLDPGGSVVVINDVLGDDEDPDWVRAITPIRTRYVGAWRDFCNPPAGRAPGRAGRLAVRRRGHVALVLDAAADRGRSGRPAAHLLGVHPGPAGRPGRGLYRRDPRRRAGPLPGRRRHRAVPRRGADRLPAR
jgi:SAM-dependent methyltransferase